MQVIKAIRLFPLNGNKGQLFGRDLTLKDLNKSKIRGSFFGFAFVCFFTINSATLVHVLCLVLLLECCNTRYSPGTRVALFREK